MKSNTDVIDIDRLARRNAVVLACAQALSGATSWVVYATAAIVSSRLVSDQSLITIPVSTFVVGLWAGTLPTSIIARHLGRRAAFEAGALCGIFAGLVCAAAVLLSSFVLLCVGTSLGGLYSSSCQSYRFAATDTASEAFKAKAISIVMAGGVFAAILGPQLTILSKNILPNYLFAGTYLAQSVFASVAATVLLLVRYPSPPTVGFAKSGRRMSELLRQSRLIVAIVCGMASFSMMNMVMTSAPVAMVACGHSITDAALGIQWHVIAMYAPSFFTGALIARFGAQLVVVAGLAILVAGAIFGSSGMTIAHFWTALALLGVGWNFSFVGATSIVTDCHRPEERIKVQGFNDFLVFGSMAIGSFLSGFQLAHFGWAMINEVVVVVLLLVAALLAWSMSRTKSRA